MTTKTVTEVSPYQAKNTLTAQKNAQAAGAFTDCFAGVCGQQAQSADVRGCTDSLNKTQRPETQKNAQQSQQRPESKEQAVTDETGVRNQNEIQDGQQTEKGVSPKTGEAVEEPSAEEDGLLKEDGQTEKVTDAVERMLAEIAAQLGMTVEQVQQAMQELNMTPVQALDGDSMKRLVMELSGAQGEADLLTDEGLYETLKELTRTLEEVTDTLCKELDLSAEQLEGMLKQAAQSDDGTQKQQEATGVIKNAGPLPEEELTEQTGYGRRESAVMDEDGPENDGPVILTEGGKSAESTAGAKNPESTPGENSHKEEHDHKNGGFMQQLNQTPADAKAVDALFTETAGESMTRTADTESIMKQIMDFMKIQVKADTTQLELQLHPANLGTVGVQIASKDGVITAQFTAQNEAVKNALETQIVQLRENLNEQGVRVEAVEVAVASHAFERNLDQNSPSDKNTGEENSPRKAKRINLNLSESAGTAEDGVEGMDEAGKLAADMMARNGNTIDFSA